MLASARSSSTHSGRAIIHQSKNGAAHYPAYTQPWQAAIEHQSGGRLHTDFITPSIAMSIFWASTGPYANKVGRTLLLICKAWAICSRPHPVRDGSSCSPGIGQQCAQGENSTCARLVALIRRDVPFSTQLACIIYEWIVGCGRNLNPSLYPAF